MAAATPPIGAFALAIASHLVLAGLASLAPRANAAPIEWRGNWAFACDFPGNDLASVPGVGGDQCSALCAGRSGCTHYSWTRYNGGTCWLKQGQVSQARAVPTADSSTVCGILPSIAWRGDWANACDWYRGDLASAAGVPADQCGPRCVARQGCTHFTWTTFNGGTCWMKQGAVSKLDAVATRDNSMVCGVVPQGPWTGVNWGTFLSSRALPAAEAVRIIKASGASAVKLFGPDRSAYAALAGSGLEVVTCAYDFAQFAQDPSSAQRWVDDNVVPFVDSVKISTIAVGNEVLNNPPPPSVDVGALVPAMRAVHNALRARGLQDRVKVVHPQHTGFLTDTYPPSASRVRPELLLHFRALLEFLSSTGAPLFINCYPYFSYIYNQNTISRDFVFFKGQAGYTDQGRYYQNLFDAMLDGPVYAAEKLGYPNIEVVVGETGWPSAGHPLATVANAAEWNSALVRKLHSSEGTPKRPGKPIRAYIFAAFDEDLKPGDPTERNFGIFYMDGRPKYPLALGA